MLNLISILILLTFASVAGATTSMSANRDFSDELTSLSHNAGIVADSIRLHTLFDLSWDMMLNEYPESASGQGYVGYGDRWTDQSFAAIERRNRLQIRQLGVLRTIERNALSTPDQLNFDLFEAKLVDRIEDSRFPGELLPLNQMGGVQQQVASVLEQMPISSVAECQDVLARLRAVPKLIEQTIVLADSGLKSGITPPQITLRELPAQVRSHIVDDPTLAPVLVGLATQPSTIDDSTWQRIVSDAHAIYREEIVPSFQRLHDYLAHTYIPGCRESIGLSALPDGHAWYTHRVKHYLTTDLTPAEVFEIGQTEVARIRAEMQSIIESTGFDGDFAAFNDFLRTDSQFFFESADDLLAAYRDICKRIDPELVRLFGKLPRLPYGVVPVPAYSERSQTTAYYQPGSARAGRPGYFYANTYDLRSRPSWEMVALTLHEAVPGHHLQIALSQELDNLPKFRSEGWYTAYGEGWALYAESLGEEMGMYDNAYVKFGQLTYEMWRAIRLVVDVGLHARGWSRQEAIDFFRENSAKTLHDITVEVDRYIAWPGQALAYKIGELKIKELRALAELELGADFDIRAFHDTVLGDGGLPLDILDKKIRTWVTQQRELAGR